MPKRGDGTAYTVQAVDRSFLLDPNLTPDLVARLVDELDRVAEERGHVLYGPIQVQLSSDTTTPDV
jgi:hypothetical protein